MVHKRITVPFNDGTMRRIRATGTAAPGLVVTHTSTVMGKGWHVTHEESGYVSEGDPWETRAQAFAYAEALSKLPINWTLPRLQLQNQLYFWRKDYAEVLKGIREAILKGGNDAGLSPLPDGA